ncbi:hypothetical protein QQF64_009292 [Cirrhinus molitorella]|uniref:Uncharacterized protein n=1 Tax=Cirrhinus molitorella TaxID=172907 RepID=A0ABR3M2B0_9TELE
MVVEENRAFFIADTQRFQAGATEVHCVSANPSQKPHPTSHLQHSALWISLKGFSVILLECKAHTSGPFEGSPTCPSVISLCGSAVGRLCSGQE